MNKLSKEEVMHVAKLGRLDLLDEETDKFSYQLKELFNEIDKINEIDLEVEDTLISPCEDECVLFKDKSVCFKNPKVLIENAPKKFDNFIEVAGVFNE